MNIIESHLALDKFIVAPYVVRCLGDFGLGVIFIWLGSPLVEA
jgi:hypothetical protein